MVTDNEETINKIVSWSKKHLLNIKYRWANNGYSIVSQSMYNFTDLPDIDYIKETGCNCIGLINLMRLKNNKHLPGFNNNMLIEANLVGSVAVWYKYLKNDFKPFDINSNYPIGTLLIKKSGTNTRYGHVAIISDHNTILHSYPEEYQEYSSELLEPGICMDNLNLINNIWKDKLNNFFDYSCDPNIWLFKDFTTCCKSYEI